MIFTARSVDKNVVYESTQRHGTLWAASSVTVGEDDTLWLTRHGEKRTGFLVSVSASGEATWSTVWPPYDGDAWIAYLQEEPTL